jgi:hypothetical protein
MSKIKIKIFGAAVGMMLLARMANGQNTNAPGTRPLAGVPAATLVPVGDYELGTNGTLLGPHGFISTASTISSGLQEAINAMPIAPNSDPSNKYSFPGGGTLTINGPGVYKFNQLVFPSYTNRPFVFRMRFKGSPVLECTGPAGSNSVITTEYSGGTLFNGLELDIEGGNFLRDANSTNAFFDIGAFNKFRFVNNKVGWTGCVTGDPGGLTWNFEVGTPAIPGIVGVWLHDSSSITAEIRDNTFEGFACGVYYSGNRGRISDNRFSCGSFFTNGTYTYLTLWTNAIWRNTPQSFLGLGPAVYYRPFDVHEVEIENNSFLQCGFYTIINGFSPGASVINNHPFGGNYTVGTYNQDGLSVYVQHNGDGAHTLHGETALIDTNATPWFAFGPPDSSVTVVSNSAAGIGLVSPLSSVLKGTTNALSAWPKAPASPGGYAVVNSNATVYMLTSTPNGTAWALTNKIAGP